MLLELNLNHQKNSTMKIKDILFTAFMVLSANLAMAQWTTPDASGNTNYPNGNVGIGNPNPYGKLDIIGNVHIRNTTNNG